jgi:hypothetical protein
MPPAFKAVGVAEYQFDAAVDNPAVGTYPMRCVSTPPPAGALCSADSIAVSEVDFASAAGGAALHVGIAGNPAIIAAFVAGGSVAVEYQGSPAIPFIFPATGVTYRVVGEAITAGRIRVALPYYVAL